MHRVHGWRQSVLLGDEDTDGSTLETRRESDVKSSDVLVLHARLLGEGAC